MMAQRTSSLKKIKIEPDQHHDEAMMRSESTC